MPNFTSPRSEDGCRASQEHSTVVENIRQVSGMLVNLNNMAGAIMDKMSLSDRLAELRREEMLMSGNLNLNAEFQLWMSCEFLFVVSS